MGGGVGFCIFRSSVQDFPFLHLSLRQPSLLQSMLDEMTYGRVSFVFARHFFTDISRDIKIKIEAQRRLAAETVW